MSVNLSGQANQQQGVALIAFLTLIVLIFSALSLKQINQSDFKNLKLSKSHMVLAEAKQALLAYSTQNYASLTCGTNCPRPGDLPCPDLDNDGEAEGSCNTQNSRLGRLPWKTLGLNDLKDGDGESLWYAVSNRYKNNPRVLPLNSDTTGSISLRNTSGQLIDDATTNSGLVALVIAPHATLTRVDGLQQSRSTDNQLVASHYLDIAFGEDNASFTEDSTDGFIAGEIVQNDQLIVNDLILPISTTQIQTVMQKHVLSEVMQAMLTFYCNGQVQTNTRQCLSNSDTFLPAPAAINNTNCLSNTDLSINDCVADDSQLFGRIPNAMPDPSDPANNQTIWEAVNTQSILRGSQANNWFQQNGWRELILYAPAPACTDSTTSGCDVAEQFLTLSNSLTPLTGASDQAKQLVLISASTRLSTQNRTTLADKSVLSSYVEGDNLTPSDFVYNRLIQNTNQNDLATSIP